MNKGVERLGRLIEVERLGRLTEVTGVGRKGKGHGNQ